MTAANAGIDISMIDDIYYDTSKNNNNTVKVEDEYGVFTYDDLASAIDSLVDGCTLYYDGALNLYEDILSGVDTLYVKGVSGVNLIAGGSASQSLKYDRENGTIIRLKRYYVSWLDENGNEFYKSDVGVGLIPVISELAYTGAAKGDYKLESVWEWSREKDGEYTSFAGLTGVAIGESVYIRPITVNITWKNGKTGAEIVEKWFKGSEVELNAFSGHDALAPNNGWYELTYFWTLDGKTVSSIKADSDVTYTSAIIPVSTFSLSNLKLNFTLNAQYTVNFYVPVPTVEGVSISGAKYGMNADVDKCGDKKYYDDIEECVTEKNIQTASVPTKTVTVAGKDYYKFGAAVYTSFAWYSASAFEFTYNVEYDGVTYELSSKVALAMLGSKTTKANVVSYFNTVMTNSPCGSEDKVLLLNWMRYINYTYIAQDATNRELVTTYKNHYECCGIDESVSAVIPKAEPTLSAPVFKEGFDSKGVSASYLVNQNYGLLQITIPKAFVDENAGKVKAYTEIKGINSETGTYGNVTYQLINSTQTTTVDGVECYYFRITTAAGVYNVNAVHNITVKCGDEVIFTTQYSLAKYIYTMNERFGTYVIDSKSGEYVESTEAKDVNDRCIEIAMALALYGEAAFEYKTEFRTAE